MIKKLLENIFLELDARIHGKETYENQLLKIALMKNEIEKLKETEKAYKCLKNDYEYLYKDSLRMEKELSMFRNIDEKDLEVQIFEIE